MSRTATGILRHGVANGHAGTDPLVEAPAPVLRSADQHRSGASSAVPIPFVPVAHSDQHDHGAMLLSRARAASACRPGRSGSGRCRRSRRRRRRRSRPRSRSMSRRRRAGRTRSRARACDRRNSRPAPTQAVPGSAGSTWYCSRQRYHDVATSGRTPRTRSSPARNRSRAAVTAWYRSASLMRWRLAVWLTVCTYQCPPPASRGFVRDGLARGAADRGGQLRSAASSHRLSASRPASVI